MRDLRGMTEWYQNGEKMESENLKGAPQWPLSAPGGLIGPMPSVMVCTAIDS